jgi:hypothetical protein
MHAIACLNFVSVRTIKEGSSCAYEDTGDMHKHQSTENRVVTYAAAALEARDTRQSIRSIGSIVAHADQPFFFNTECQFGLAEHSIAYRPEAACKELTYCSWRRSSRSGRPCTQTTLNQLWRS